MDAGGLRRGVLAAAACAALLALVELGLVVAHGHAVVSDQARYRPAQCRVTASEQEYSTVPPLGPTGYRITYEYCALDPTGTCRGGLTSVDGFGGKADGAEWARRSQGAETFECFYDPRDPSRSVLVRGYTGEYWGELAVWATLLVLASGLGLVAWRRR